MTPTPSVVLKALSTVIDPKRKKSIVRLDRIRSLSVSEQEIRFTVVLPDPGSAFARDVARLCREALAAAFGPDVHIAVETDGGMIGLGDDIEITGGGKQEAKVPPGVVSYIAVASGKGGVGKSTVAVNLAIALAQQGYAVGLVDTDIYGPSIPTMFGLTGEKPRVNERRKIEPLERYGVRVLSMGFLVEEERAVIWRGPMVSSAVRQFLGDAEWGELDYLVLDLPPGTGDIQLTIVQTVPLTGAIIVSTPQEVALSDARKGVAMFGSVNVPVLGIVENMAYFTPPDLPDRKYHLFGQGGARRLAESLGVSFLGEVPIEQAVREGGDEGKPIVIAEPESQSAKAFRVLAEETAAAVAVRNAQKPPTQAVEILYR